MKKRKRQAEGVDCLPFGNWPFCASTIPDAAKLARYDDLANLVEELHDENMRLRARLHESTAENQRLVLLLAE